MTTLRRQLLLRLIAALVSIQTVAGVSLYLLMGHGLSVQFNAAQLAIANSLITLVTEEDGVIEFEFSDEVMPLFESEVDPEYFELWLSDGSVFERSNSLHGGDLLKDVGTNGEPKIWNIELPDGRRGRAIGIEFSPQIDSDSDDLDFDVEEGLSNDTVVLVYARSRESLIESSNRLFATLLILTVLLTLVSSAAIYFSVETAVRPLTKLANEVSKIESSDLHHKFQTDGVTSEIATLASHLNALLARLEAAFQRERRFTADVAHELRTPLAELRTIAQVAVNEFESRPIEPDPIDYFRDYLASTQHMEKLVDTLLSLVRSEAGAVRIETETIDIVPIITNAWAQEHRSAKLEQDLDTKYLPQNLFVETDPDLLGAIVTNLFSNAYAYTDQQQTVDCQLERSESGTILTITNKTQELESSDLDNLLLPFWQKDSARSKRGSCGLGLSIVVAYAKLLDLEFHIEMPEDELFRANIIFPAR